jgi:hypothetical protein|tara:strand:- start:441 stop:614 length:174 start_codon:yes stop_codon:yes gene_type:complete
MNITLTDVEINIIEFALEAVAWQQRPADQHGKSQADRVKRIQRKLVRAASHADTVFE